MTAETIQNGNKLDDLILQAVSLKKKLDRISAEQKAVKAERDDILFQIRDLMDEQGTLTAGTQVGNAIISEKVVASVKDWDEVWSYVVSNEAFHLLPRSINAAAYREYLNAGQEIPGIEPFVKRDINVRKK